MAANSATTVGFVFAVQIGISIIAFFLFSSLRLMASLRRFYAPKRFDKSLEEKPRRLPPGFFSWWYIILTTSEEEVLRVAGLDMAVFIRILTFGAETFFYISLWVLVVVLPTNLSGTQVKDILNAASNSTFSNESPSPSPPVHQPPVLPPYPPYPPFSPGYGPCAVQTFSTIQRQVAWFDICSITNLGNDSPKFWVHMVSVYVVTIIVLMTGWKYNKEATILRIMYVANTPRGGPSHTVLITDIPGMDYGTLRSFVRGFVGSTLFIMLPKSLKMKVMDFVEEGVSAARNTLSAENIAKRAVRYKNESGYTYSLPAEQGNREASSHTAGPGPASSMSVQQAASSNNVKRKNPAASHQVQLRMTEDELDVWKQAAQKLGVMAKDEEQDKVLQAFIQSELDFSYGSNHVAAVNPVWDQEELENVLNEYNKLKTELEDYLDFVASRLRRKQKVKRLMKRVIGATMGVWGTSRYGLKPVKVDALVFWRDRLQELDRLLPEAQSRALMKPIPSAFVTFNTRAMQTRAASSLHSHDESLWCIQGAPSPSEILWRNLRMRSWQRGARATVLWMAYGALVLFFVIPVAVVQGFVNLDNLARFPGLYQFIQLPFINQFLMGILPSLVMMIFLALVPFILQTMCKLAGLVSFSKVDFAVVNMYFYFQVVVVFLFNMVAGTFIYQYNTIINDPSTVITALGIAIPQTASFFITYILTSGIGKEGIKFLRLVNLVIFLVLSRTASTPRARMRLWTEQHQGLGSTIPYYMMAFFLGVMYCIINPIIAPTLLIYLMMAILAQRYNVMYVFKPMYESGGQVWGTVLHQVMVSLYLMQIFMLVLLSIKAFRFAPLIVPLIFFTFLFHVSVYLLFNRPWRLLSVHDAAMLDLRDQAERGSVNMKPEELRDIREMYLSPVFKVKAGDIDELLREAAIANRRIDGERIEDIEQQLDDAGYVSAEEADDRDVEAAVANNRSEELHQIATDPPSSPWTFRKGMAYWTKKPSESAGPYTSAAAGLSQQAVAKNTHTLEISSASADLKGLSKK
ncbi:hypothetical protein CEUSTIGMA_g351.t1 [Chlamydomonas eustigma]|uniref:CSC1/OSCA1-like 7TM region domain-containing protein n=1 Tax=Chlamydomonas eustigma TaxID=1157962 RepID=A0A250WQB6_9CHLO|nr:hypothetical protein CEUSTIGMA_g351.t1 [Chlamydomonas eustigma]|eukprot:GAX72896.1 hypothetical protein CEUSTIGMA_g351.t1 [Chlamydomonas eustigma]